MPLTTDLLDCRQSHVNEVSMHFRASLSCRLVSPTSPSASEIISSAKRRTPTQRRAFSGIHRLFSSHARVKKQHAGYRPTYDKVPNGLACRIYGSVEVKKVTANLHVTTLGHGYMSHEHTDHQCTSFACTATDDSDESLTYRPRVLLRPILPRHIPTTRPQPGVYR